MTIRRTRGGGTRTYSYTDETGKVLYEVVRRGNPRKFFQRRPDGKGGYVNNLSGVRRILYRLPAVLAAVREGQRVYVVEGERDADNLGELGLVATTNSGGPGHWRKDYSKALRGARVAILPDNDEPGREHAQKIALALQGVAAEVRLVELPDLPAGGDVTAWIEAMERQGSDDTAIRAELERLVAEAEVLTLAHDGTSAGVERAEKALQGLWALGKDPKPAAVERALTRVAGDLQGSNLLAVQTAREVALRALKGKVRAPAKLVDAALGSVAMAPQPQPRAEPEPEAEPMYLATEDGLVHRKTTRDGTVNVQLTNFTAEIVSEVRHDDGVEVQRSFEIAACHEGVIHRFKVGSGEFSAMRWVADKLGATAIVNAGMGTKDHARAAIQHLSEDVAVRTVYTHLGWRKMDSEWVYLHAGGAIGTVGTVAGIEVDLPEQLRLYVLPDPPTGEELIRAIRASLRTLDLLPDRIALPTSCATWRAPLGPSDLSVHVTGQTGEGKSEFAARQAQHYGPGLDARNLPGSWTSTGNSLEVLAFHAKDSLLVVDDFAPSGTFHDVQRLHREAARLFRSRGNQAARGRLRPDSTLQPDKPPRALILSTGEDIPAGHSIRARIWVEEIPAGEMDWELLSECQQDASEGLYAAAMAGYLRWLASQYEELQEHRRVRTAELRAEASTTVQHRRTPAILADLAFGMETFLDYARDAGALDEAEARDLWDRTWAALGEAAELQAEHLEAADPVPRFLDLLRSAIVAGRAHVVSAGGGEPPSLDRWGWREKTTGVGETEWTEWQRQGEQIGWVEGEDLYLDPDTAFGIAQRMSAHDGVSVSSRTLWKRFKEAGILATTDEKRQRNTIRVTLQSSRREVLHLRSTTLLPEAPSQPSQPSRPSKSPSPRPRTQRLVDLVSRGGRKASGAEPSQKTVPRGAHGAEPPASGGTVGTVGTVAETKAPRETDDWGEV